MTDLKFFRRVAFGIKPDQAVPSDALSWAKAQVDEVQPLTWKGEIQTIKQGLERYAFLRNETNAARKKFKKSPSKYQEAQRQIWLDSGVELSERRTLQIRFDSALNSAQPVLERFAMFWANHFAIIDKDELPQLATGPFHREIIRPNLTGSYENLVKEATTSWAMIEALDNGESIAPNSRRGLEMKMKNLTPTVNENHARELMELHTISPAAGYTQEDVIQLSYVMAGWRPTHKPRKMQQFTPIKFNPEYHQPGKLTVLGKIYEQRGLSAENKLLDAIKDFSNHPECKKFISFKLCRHFVTDNPTDAMVGHVVKAWNSSNGALPEIHKAVLEVAFENLSSTSKYQNPEIWFLQAMNIAGSKEPSFDIPEKLEILGHNPLRPIQPNGFPDTEAEWLSPEFLIRRLTFAKNMANVGRSYDISRKLDIENMVRKNFSNSDELIEWMGPNASRREKLTLLFPSNWMLFA